MKNTARIIALEITSLYAFFSSLWILTSDAFLGALFAEPKVCTYWQTVKGWGFVALTALLLFSLIFRELNKRQRIEIELRSINRTLQVLSECKQVIIHATTEAQIWQDLRRILVEVGGYDTAWIQNVPTVVPPDDESNHADRQQLNQMNRDRFDQMIRNTLETAQPTIDSDLCAITFPLRQNQGAIAPPDAIASSTRVFGVLTIFASPSNTFHPREILLLTELADDLAYAIISLRTRAEKDRTQGQLHFKNTLLECQTEAAIDGILVVSQDWQVISFNRKFLEMWEIPPAIIDSKDFSQILQIVLEKVTNPQELEANILALYDHPRESKWEEITLKDGRILERYSAPIRSQEDIYYGRVCYFRDITERKQSAELLQEQLAIAESLQTILNSIGDGVAVFDPNGNLIYLNQAAAEIYRQPVNSRNLAEWSQKFRVYTPDKQQLLSPEELPIMKSLRGADIAKADVYMEYAGTLEGIYLSITASPILKSEVITGAVLICRDISARIESEQFIQKAYEDLEKRVKQRTTLLRNANQVLRQEICDRIQTEAALRKSEERFRRVVDSNMLGVIFWESNGNITETNDAFLTMMGYTKTEVKAGQLNWKNLTPSEYYPLDDQSLSEIAKRGICTPFEKEYIRQDGSRIPVLVGAAALDSDCQKGVCFVIDITEQKRAQQALKESEERYRQLVELCPDGIFIQCEGKFVFLNQAALDIYGAKKAEELLGKSVLKQVHLREREVVSDRIHQLNQNHQKTPLLEQKLIRIDGSFVDVEVAGIPFTYQGKPAAQVVVRDISDRKQAAAALAASEKKYRSLVENLADGIYLVGQDFQLIYLNPAIEGIYGRSKEFLYGDRPQSFLSCIHPEDQDNVKAVFFSDSFTGDRVEVNYRIIHPNGEIRHLRDVVNVLRDAEGSIQGYLGILSDLTELKQTQEALQKSQQQLQAILDNSTAVIFLKDIQGRYLLINRQYQTLVHITQAEIQGKTDYDLYPQEIADSLWLHDLKVLETGQSMQWEETIALDDGIHTYLANKFPLYDSAGVAYAVGGISTDITQRKRAERELQQLNENLEAQVAQRTSEIQTFFEAIPDHIFVIEREQMRVTFCNNHFARAVGFDHWQQVQGKTIFECFDPDLSAYFARQNEEVFQSQQIYHEQESFSLGDRFYYFDTYKVPVKKNNGEVYALVGAARDVTELLETKQALAERTAQLEALNQELNSFSYSVSHDLRAPLRHVMGFVNALSQQLAATETRNDPKIQHYLNVIQESAKKMGQLIDGLLTLSRLGRQELIMSPVNLNELVERAIALVNSQSNLSDSSPIEFKINPLPTVIGDPTLLQQVFTNLIENAVKFSRHSQPREIEVATLPDGTFFVKDNGVGFQMEYADQLFAPFQRLHSVKEFEGTGLGLAIVQRIIHRHHGSIWVESAPNQGTCFYFSLPRTV